jgi:hypothetical protein
MYYGKYYVFREIDARQSVAPSCSRRFDAATSFGSNVPAPFDTTPDLRFDASARVAFVANVHARMLKSRLKVDLHSSPSAFPIAGRGEHE